MESAHSDPHWAVASDEIVMLGLDRHAHHRQDEAEVRISSPTGQHIQVTWQRPDIAFVQAGTLISTHLSLHPGADRPSEIADFVAAVLAGRGQEGIVVSTDGDSWIRTRWTVTGAWNRWQDSVADDDERVLWRPLEAW